MPIWILNFISPSLSLSDSYFNFQRLRLPPAHRKAGKKTVTAHLAGWCPGHIRFKEMALTRTDADDLNSRCNFSGSQH